MVVPLNGQSQDRALDIPEPGTLILWRAPFGAVTCHQEEVKESVAYSQYRRRGEKNEGRQLVEAGDCYLSHLQRKFGSASHAHETLSFVQAHPPRLYRTQVLVPLRPICHRLRPRPLLRTAKSISCSCS